MENSSKQGVLFPTLFSKPIQVVFDGEAQSSDGGGLLLAAVEQEMDLIAKLCRHIVDPRDPLRIEYSVEELFRQRAFSVALGYADANDAQELRRDPALKPMCGRSAGSAVTLGSQPTISRFENAPSARAQAAMIHTFESEVIARLKQAHR